MERIEMLQYIHMLKKLSYKELKILLEIVSTENHVKLIELEMNRRIYASN